MTAESGNRAALYLRLSKDDEGQGESGSIHSQRCMLLAYAKERGFAVCGEYVDDGYSGTTFQRPGFQRLLEDIERGLVDLVLTKDLSRLGRDYIQVGQYTELYFPIKGVRFIAVNDGYDSAGPWRDLAPFQNLVNEMYARDASRKIRSALYSRMGEGEFVGPRAPYGYCRDPQNRHRLVPDEPAAGVVRELFRRSAQGATPGELARELTALGIPPFRQSVTPGGGDTGLVPGHRGENSEKSSLSGPLGPGQEPQGLLQKSGGAAGAPGGLAGGGAHP